VITAQADNTYNIIPQFISSTNGRLFSLFYRPTPEHTKHPKTAVLYFPPFAEELNKSRRMVALQAGQFCHAGYAVLIVDLFGTGDSEGDFGEANWEIWQKDMCVALSWLQDKGFNQFIFWGLRLGAIMALQTAALLSPKTAVKVVKFIFWQPTVKGEMLLTQFLRLRMAADFLVTGNKNSGNEKNTPSDIRQHLSNGQNVEIAGYSLSPTLAQTIDRLDLKTLKPTPSSKVVWLEIIPTKTRGLSPLNEDIVNEWCLEKIETKVVKIVGQPFWNSLEIIELPELLEATTLRVVDNENSVKRL